MTKLLLGLRGFDKIFNGISGVGGRPKIKCGWRVGDKKFN